MRRGVSDFKTFTCSYNFDGSEWTVQFPARDFDEASRRLRAMGMSGKVNGKLVASIPTNTLTLFPLSILLPIVVAVRNFFHRLFKDHP